MQEIFEKIIEKLKEKVEDYDNIIERRGSCCIDITNIIRKLEERAIGIERAIEIVNQIAAEYNNGWIPVNEDNLPKDREDVLILWGGGNRSTAYHISGGAGGWFFNYGFDYKGNAKVPYEPYAWKPLPEPYQPKGE